jgi:hypothetical protein
MKLRNYKVKDLEKILELNEESVHFLSPLTKNSLKKLISECDFTLVVEVKGNVEAFILALSENKDYKSVNYQWFSKKYDEFLYIDRVVVSKKYQSQGLGKHIYNNIIKKAKRENYPYLLAEIDVKPSNPKSLSFHKSFGFKEVGRQSIYNGKKVVSLQALNLK